MRCSIYFPFYQDFVTLLYQTASLQSNALNGAGVVHTLHDSRCVYLFIRKLKCNAKSFFCFWCNSHQWCRASSFTRFLDHTQTHHTLQDYSERVDNSSQRPDNTQHSQQTNIHARVGFEPTISADKRPQTYALDNAATGTGPPIMIINRIYENKNLLSL